MESQTLTLNVTLTVTAEPNVTAEDKEASFRQLVTDQVNSLALQYDWGIAVTGALESTAADTVTFDLSQPEYTD